VAKILKGSKLSLLLSLNFLDKQKELNLFPTKTSRISVEQKKRLLLDQKQLVRTQRNWVNERKRLLARKTITDPRILCVVSKKKKRNEQHYPLSPPRNERRRKEKENSFNPPQRQFILGNSSDPCNLFLGNSFNPP